MDKRDKARLAREAERMYKQGWTVREIAQHMNRSYGYVHQLLSGAGVKFRKRGGRRS